MYCLTFVRIVIVKHYSGALADLNHLALVLHFGVAAEPKMEESQYGEHNLSPKVSCSIHNRWILANGIEDLHSKC